MYPSERRMMFLGIAAALVTATVILLPLLYMSEAGSQVMDTQVMMLAISEAAEDYKDKFDKYPAELDALTHPLHDESGNRVGDPLLEPQPHDRDASGRFIDRWGTPLRITLGPDAQTMTLHSAGADTRFDTDDDVILPLPRASTLEESDDAGS